MEIRQEVVGTRPMPRMVALAMAFLTTAFITTSVALMFAGGTQVAGAALVGA